jgi:hypothetical protein
MKSFVFWFVAALVAISVLKNHRRHEPDREPAHHRSVVARKVTIHHGPHDRVLFHVEGDNQATYTLAQLKDRFDDRVVFEFGADDEDDNKPSANDEPRRVEAEGLPVPIIPGTRVTQAKPEPPQPPAPPRASKAPKAPRDKHKKPTPPKPLVAAKSTPAPLETMKVTGRLSATEERAKKDAFEKLQSLLAERFASDVPKTWKVPTAISRRMILETKVSPYKRDYGTVYDATLLVDVSPARRVQIASAYHQEQVWKRLAVLGGLLGFVLTCLGAVSGYIKADEATKGYYTNALRLAAAVGVGGAGVVIYQTLA